MKNEQRIKELEAFCENLKKGMPSWTTIPVTDIAEARELDKREIAGVVQILDGEFQGVTVLMKRIEMVEEDKIEIHYTAFDTDANELKETPALDKVLGDITNLLMARAVIADLSSDE